MRHEVDCRSCAVSETWASRAWAWMRRLARRRPPDPLTALIERGDERLLRDVGLTLDRVEGAARRHLAEQQSERDAFRRWG